ncbi:hypothetical protein ACFQ0D_03185 [Micromonospora zhanjiangensis]
MLNEAYTWVVTVAVGLNAAGGAVAGVVVDRLGGAPVAFLIAGVAVGGAALVAARPSGSIARADATATARTGEDLAAEPV